LDAKRIGADRHYRLCKIIEQVEQSLAHGNGDVGVGGVI
jgi:phage baseplate assembly protein gpV